LQLERDVDRVGAVDGFADDLEILFRAQRLDEALAKRRVIVDDENADERALARKRRQPVTSIRPSAPSLRL
jgi:hypothetical protein